jgi:ASC-1-like (ASCH) protein
MGDIKVITICGSMRYAKEMMKISEQLELQDGYAVIQCVYSTNGTSYDDIDIHVLDKLHRKKIAISDAIYVVNIDGYIGSSTQKEIVYAKELGKDILYHVKEYYMKLNAEPFEQMNSKEKQIEYRLYDDKRQQLKVGDNITFTKLPDEDKTLQVVITDLKRYKTLLEMYEDSFDQYLNNYYSSPQEVVDDTTYYSDEEIQQYGCLAIHIKKIAE